MATIEETKRMIEVMQAYVDGKEIELVYSCGSVQLMFPSGPAWNWSNRDYRVRETPDTIDWSHISVEFKYMTRDRSGQVWLSNTAPELLNNVWVLRDKMVRVDVFLASYRRGTVDWKDSLVERPEGV